MSELPKNIQGVIGKKLLGVTEYVAENAFIAPGFHRLFTATGLSLGLWGGRRVMDVVTAKRPDGTELKSEDVSQFLRPIYGKMRYNGYSDDPHERWKYVADKFAPAVLGGLGAWAGSAFFAHGHNFMNGQPFHGPTAAAATKRAEGKMSMQVADNSARDIHANVTRTLASVAYPLGAGSGGHLFGGGAPLTSIQSANSFQQQAGRKINLFGWRWANRVLFGNRSLGSSATAPAMVTAAKWAEGNLVKFGDPKNWLKEEDLLFHAKAALQEFPHVTAEMEKNVAGGMRALIEETHTVLKGMPIQKPGKLSEVAYAHLIGQPKEIFPNSKRFGFLDQAFDRMLVKSGVPLEQAEIGSRDAFSFLSRLLSLNKSERKLEAEYAGYLKKEYNIDYGPSRVKIDPKHAAIGWGAVGVSTLGAIVTGTTYSHRLERRTSRTEDPHVLRHISANTPQNFLQPAALNITANPSTEDKQQPSLIEPKRKDTSWINGRPLDMAQWGARVLIKPPSMHRLMGAAFLSAALFGGMKFANVLAGRDLKLLSKANPASVIAKENTWKIFQPLHGKLAYTPGSVDIADRWKQAAHYIIPVVFGGYGTYLGSKTYFHDRVKKLEKPESLEDYADKILMEQSKPFGTLTAVTSIFNTGSGFHMLPIVNYSANLNNRFLMGSGQQVALPGIGKWWSGNPGMTPWGVKGTLRFLTNYLSNNDSPRPEELPTQLHALIEKLYPALGDEAVLTKKQIMLNRIYEVRDTYLVDGKIPPEKKEKLHEVMEKLVTGEGFEVLLQLAGLDPAKADLSSNGVSGKMANALGAKSHVRALESEYRGRLQQRLTKADHLSPSEYLHALADRSAEHVAQVGNEQTANDNTQEKSFANRVLSGNTTTELG